MDVTISAGYSNKPYDLRLRVYTIENNVGGNYSRYHWDLYIQSRSGNGSYDLDNSGWQVWIAGQYWSGSHNLDFRGDYAGKTIGLASGETSGVGHDGNGNATFAARAQQGGGYFGNADTGDQWMAADRITRPPLQPGAPAASGVQPTQVTMSWAIPDGRGGGIDQMLLRYSTDSTMASYVDVPLAGSATSMTVTGLTPGTTYYWWLYAHNAAGYSPRSDTTTQGTLSSSAPSLAVLTDISGQSALVKMTPPGNASGVTKYLLEWREVGGPDPAQWNAGVAAVCPNEDTGSNCYWDANVQGNGLGQSFTRGPNGTVVYANRVSFKNNTYTVTGLTPGKAYEYRAVAYFGSYVSPSTGFVRANQPNPNTSPGDFYDGSSAAKPDLAFVWEGPIGASRSLAMGRVPVGWRTFGQGTTLSGGTGAVHQATGGYAGTSCSRAVFFTDCVSDRFVMGNNFAGASDVVPGVPYFAMIHVQLPGRAQRLQAGIAWQSGDELTTLSYSWGSAQVVDASASSWTELSIVGAVAPAGAARAAAVVRDVSGPGWSLWLSGQEMRADATFVGLAPSPYFDGDTPDTPTIRYDWMGDAHASASTKTVVSTGLADPLIDPDVLALPTPPLPPIIGGAGVENITLWRTFVLQVPASSLYAWRAVIPTVIIGTGSASERQVRVRFIPNPGGLPVDQIDFTDWDAEYVIAFIPANTQMTLDGITRRASASVGGADPRPANHLLSGTDGGPASWPEFRCGIPYAVSFDVPPDSTIGNLSPRLILTPRM